MYLLRNRTQFIKGAFLILFGLFILSASIVDRVKASLLGPALVAAAFAVLAWVFYFRPFLRTDDGGVTIHNWIRVIHIPWDSYRGHTSRYGLAIENGDRKDTVVSYPGTGGLAAGRAHLRESRGKEVYASREVWLKPSADSQWASLRQARLALSHAAELAGAPRADSPASGKNVNGRTVSYDANAILGLLIAAGMLVLAGIVLF